MLGKIIGKKNLTRQFGAVILMHTAPFGVVVTRTDFNGCVVEELLEDEGLVCLNDGRITGIEMCQEG